MYNPNRHPLEDGPKKYGAAAGTEELFKQTYAGDKADDSAIDYHDNAKYDPGKEDDPLKAGYKTGAGEKKDKDKDQKDELWDKLQDKKEETDEAGLIIKKVAESFAQPEKESNEEKKRKRDDENRKKHAQSVEDLIGMMQEKQQMDVVDLDKKETEVIKAKKDGVR